MLYQKKSRRKPLIFKIAALMLVLFLGVFCLFEFKARDLVANLVGNELEIQSMSSIDQAVSDVLGSIDIDYRELVSVNTTAEGSVTSLSTNTTKVNKLKAELSLKITEYIKNDKKVTVKVPSGAFTGLVLLSDLGPKIPISLSLGGSVITTINSDFSSAGINQTIHRVYLTVDADVSLTCPIINYECSFVTEYELCQTVIVGSTPEVLANIA